MVVSRLSIAPMYFIFVLPKIWSNMILDLSKWNVEVIIDSSLYSISDRISFDFTASSTVFFDKANGKKELSFNPFLTK